VNLSRITGSDSHEGKLLHLLFAEQQFEFMPGMDVSWRSLEMAKDRLRIEEMRERQRVRMG
jgi:hypothetical protein